MTNPAPEAALGPATTDAVVNVTWSDTTAASTITRISVAGRPGPRPYQGEGNHTIAFSVYGDVLRRRLIGLTRPQAAAELLTLVNVAHTDAERDRLAVSPRRTRFLDAAARCRAGLTASNLGGDAARTNLVVAIRAYLSCRNYAPLASGWLGAGRAIGAGEAATLRRLRRNEAPNAQVVAAGDMRTAIWSMLDRRVLQHILAGDIAGVPGVPADTPAARHTAVVDVVSRHLTAISLAYPISYFESSVYEDARVIEYLETVGPDGWPDAFPGVPEAEADAPLAPAGWSAGAGAGALVSMEYTATGGGTVTGLHARGRSLTTLGVQGHHLTAHVVFERLLSQAVVGRTLGNARTELLAAVATIDDTPSWPRDGGRVGLIPAGRDYGERFDTARSALAGEVATLTGAVDPGAIFDGLCRVSAAYLNLRNALPLVAVTYGRNSDGAGEAAARARLDGFEPDPRPQDAAEIFANMWKLFSLDAAAQLINEMSPGDLYALSAGAPGDPLVRMAVALDTHRASMELAWPNCYAACDFGSRSSAYAAIDAMNIVVLDRPALATAAGFAEEDGPERAPLKGVDDDSRKRKDSEVVVPRDKSKRVKKPVDYTYQPSIGDAEDDFPAGKK